MTDASNLHSLNDLIFASVSESRLILDTIAGREDEPAMIGYAEYGVPWHWAPCQGQAGLDDIATYRSLADNTSCSAWMDNTTILTACVLMSTNGPEVMTPLTVWDLATFVRSVVCYERIYHHEHPDIDDSHINKLLGGDVLYAVPLPIRETKGNRILPDPWDGAHRFMCDTWDASYGWLKRLHESVDGSTLDGKQLQLVTDAWRVALGNPDLKPSELVDYKEVNLRWRSPSNQLLVDAANVTTVDDTQIYLDPNEKYQAMFKRKRELGVHDESKEQRSYLLSDLNLRAYINQRFAEFFTLPYACSASRMPFRSHLYDQSVRVQQELTVAKIIDHRYTELGQTVQLRLPVFLALALRDADSPEKLWASVVGLRKEASAFRSHREEMDRVLARGDIKEATKISKALHTSVESLLKVAGDVTASAGAVIIEDVSKGDIPTVSTGISAVVAAAKGGLKSSFAERLMWRLRRPQLLWINNIVDQSHHLTEAMPDFSRIWQIPPNRKTAFSERFRKMGDLAG